MHHRRRALFSTRAAQRRGPRRPGRRAWRVAALIAAAAALLAPIVATAALPKPTKATIVPFKSIGPVALGTTQAKALSKWGHGDCGVGTGGRTTCTWLSTSSSDFPEEGAVIEVKNGKVCGMYIRAGTNSAAHSLTITRLKKWKTAGGVGLGSSLRAAKKVLGGKLIASRHHVDMSFSSGYAAGTQKRVATITINRVGCTVT